jgi:hypothetical protein
MTEITEICVIFAITDVNHLGWQQAPGYRAAGKGEK